MYSLHSMTPYYPGSSSNPPVQTGNIIGIFHNRGRGGTCPMQCNRHFAFPNLDLVKQGVLFIMYRSESLNRHFAFPNLNVIAFRRTDKNPLSVSIGTLPFYFHIYLSKLSAIPAFHIFTYVKDQPSLSSHPLSDNSPGARRIFECALNH